MPRACGLRTVPGMGGNMTKVMNRFVVGVGAAALLMTALVAPSVGAESRPRGGVPTAEGWLVEAQGPLQGVEGHAHGQGRDQAQGAVGQEAQDHRPATGQRCGVPASGRSAQGEGLLRAAQGAEVVRGRLPQQVRLDHREEGQGLRRRLPERAGDEGQYPRRSRSARRPAAPTSRSPSSR